MLLASGFNLGRAFLKTFLEICGKKSMHGVGVGWVGVKGSYQIVQDVFRGCCHIRPK